MLVSRILGTALCFGVGVLHPVTAAARAVARKDAAATARWLAFFSCATLMALPLAWLPAWTPLRLECLFALLWALSAVDARGAAAAHARYVQPLLRPLEEARTRLAALTTDECFGAVERALTRPCRLSPPPPAREREDDVPDGPTADTEE